MPSSINPAFRSFSYGNILDPQAFIKQMQAAKPSLNTEASKWQGSGSEDGLGFEKLKAASQLAENVFVAQMKDAPKTIFRTQPNVQALVFGGTGNDTIQTGDKGDILIGGKGINLLTGGLGSDLFIVGQGKDVLTDFTSEDMVTIVHPPGQKPSLSWSVAPNISIIDFYAFDCKLSNGNMVRFGISLPEAMKALNIKKADEVRSKKPEALLEQLKSKLEAQIYFEELTTQETPKPIISDNRDLKRGGTDDDGNQDIWGQTTGGMLKGGDGKDILHSRGGTTTMSGGLGADHFHVLLGVGTNIITDFNFQQQDRIVINGLQGDFDAAMVSVENSGNNFIVSYGGQEVARLGKFEGMPMSDATNRIKSAVRGGQQAEGAYDNVYYGFHPDGKLKIGQIFKLPANQTTRIAGFEPQVGNDISFPGLEPQDVKNRVGYLIAQIAQNKIEFRLTLDNKPYAVFTPPADESDFGAWRARMVKLIESHQPAQ
jgi:hypothetical protein